VGRGNKRVIKVSGQACEAISVIVTPHRLPWQCRTQTTAK
jgi:hypothetical protein